MRQLIIAFADRVLAHKVRTLLRGCGIRVDETCTSASAVLQSAARMTGGGLILCSSSLPDMSAASLMELLPETFDMLVVVSSRQQTLYDRPGMFVLNQPFQQDMLADSIKQILDTRQLSFASPAAGKRDSDTSSKQRSQDEEKLIAQAKYLLMQRRKMSEPEAHRYLQRKSMESGARMVDLARHLISRQ